MQPLTGGDLAAFLGIEEDARCADAVAAAVDWAQDRRSLTPPQLLWMSPRVRSGAILYAALLYQARATPTGLAGYDDFNNAGSGLAGDAIWRAKELIGADQVIA